MKGTKLINKFCNIQSDSKGFKHLYRLLLKNELHVCGNKMYKIKIISVKKDHKKKCYDWFQRGEKE